MAKLQKISRGGQLSVPATVRKRQGTETVLVEDHGDALVVRPAPDDPIEAGYGAFASTRGPGSSAIRRDERRAEAERDTRRQRVRFLDAYALVAFLTGERAASQVRDLLREGDVGMGAVSLAETVDVMLRRRGVEPGGLRRTLDPLLDGVLATVPFERHQAWRAGAIRAAHHHRVRRPISTGDCALLALAAAGDAVVTADSHVLAVAEAEGVDAIALGAG